MNLAFALSLLLALFASGVLGEEPQTGIRLETVPLRGLRGPVAALIATGVEGGGLPASALAWHHGGPRAAFSVDVSPVTAEEAVRELEIYAYAMDTEGRVRDFVACSVAGKTPFQDGGGVRFVGSLRMADTETPLRILVVEPRSLAYRLLVVPVAEESAPIPEEAEAFLLPPREESLAEAPPGEETLPPSLPSRKSRRRKALEETARRGYREALTQLASGRPPAAVAEILAGVESRIFELGSIPASFAAHEIEMKTARDLGRAEPDVLLPIALLHMELYEQQVARRRYYLADLSRRASSALALELAAASPNAEAVRPAAEVLLCLAVATTVRDEKLRLLTEARRIAADHDTVSLVTATIFERESLYPEAVEVLDELVRRHPANAEGRLRLAVNLDRVGRSSEAEDQLRLLVDGRLPDWVLTVTYQQLVRRRLRDGRREEAVALLGRAIERLPESGRLALQLAWALDRGGEPARARELIAAFGPMAEESPRHLYSGARALEETRRSLVEQGRLRVAALRRALE